ncbi:MAG TPA: ComEC/Rec2 family competence protein, partial [Myxococcaceae bacterium]|nr:ComEC/Rec2 family competence protein [Myxococcaceae bacterium]
MALARLFFVLLLLLAALPARAATPPAPGALSVYFFDVGQGDAALIVSPTGKTVLIDGGPPEADERLVPRLRELVRGPLDLVILTHPHLDHLGGLVKILQEVGAKRFMDPGFDHPSESYRTLLEVVGREVGQVMVPTPNPSAPEKPLTIGLGEGTTLTIFWPRHPLEDFLERTRSDANSNSIVARLTYGKTAFLFTGDAEPETEEHLLGRPLDFTSTVLKVAHHGGRHSSTEPFLAAVRPQAAVISCGRGNEYGHPTEETLQRLDAVGARTFRTDQQGEVLAVSDGATVRLTPTRKGKPTVVTGQANPGPVGTAVPTASGAPRGAAPAPSSSEVRFVSLKGSKVFHREDCATLARAKT